MHGRERILEYLRNNALVIESDVPLDERAAGKILSCGMSLSSLTFKDSEFDPITHLVADSLRHERFLILDFPGNSLYMQLVGFALHHI